MTDNFSWLVGGEAGNGIMFSGRFFAKILTRAGFQTFGYTEYPSLVRGGHNSFQVRVSDHPLNTPSKKLDLLIALNQETFNLHSKDLDKGAGVIFDPGVVKPEGIVKTYPLHLEKMAEELGNKILRNTIAVGASLGAIGVKSSLIDQALKEEFANKDPKVVEMNLKAAQAGYDYFQKTFGSLAFNVQNLKSSSEKLVCLSGNEAIALGAIAAGCKFYSAYPMTPVSSILHFLANHGPRYGAVVKQAENEIAAISEALGASFAGVRSMTATSGGGFCLMTESVSLAAMTETPLVIIEGQRPAPATGVPTWTNQGDAAFVLHTSHGDFPRIVLAPRTIEECFYLTFEAFNLADQLQNPVIVLVDKLLCESVQSVPALKTDKLQIKRGKLLEEIPPDYKRYMFTEDGISPRALPGQQGGVFLANSDEHDEFGFSSEEAENRNKMMAKRDKKLQIFKKQTPPIEIEGAEKPQISLFTWGSSFGAVREAVEKLKSWGIDANLISLSYLNPLPVNFEDFFVSDIKKVFIEVNFSGQVADWIREKTGKEFDLRVLKDDGRPFYPGEIAEKVKEFYDRV